MKISAAVIRETLAPLGKWNTVSRNDAAFYTYPHLFTDTGPSKGHVLVISPEELTDDICGHQGILAVLTAPPGTKKALSCSALVPSRPVQRSLIWQTLTELYDSLEQWENDLNSCIPDLAGLRRMLDISAGRMHGDLILIDVSYNVPAFTDTGAAEVSAVVDIKKGRASEQTIAGLADDPQIASARTLKGVQLYESDIKAYGAPSTLYRNMFRKGESSYYNRLLFMRSSGRYTETDRFMLEMLAQKIERISEHLSTYAVPLSDHLALKQHLLRVTDPAYHPDSAAAGVLSPLGWKQDDSYRFLIFRSLYEVRDAGISDFILRSLEKILPGSCGVADGSRILMIQNMTRAAIPLSVIRPALADFLRENLYKAGISNEFRSFYKLRGAYHQADAALTLGSERDPMFWYYMFGKYLSDYIMKQALAEMPSDMLVLPALERLIRHDREKGTVYAETLRVLAEENYNTSRAAKRLFIHRSTLQDRLERLHNIADLDLENSEIRALIWFGFRLADNYD